METNGRRLGWGRSAIGAMCMMLLALLGCGGGGGGGGGGSSTASMTNDLYLDGSTDGNVFIDGPGIGAGTDSGGGGGVGHAPEPATIFLFAGAALSAFGVTRRKRLRN